MRHRFTLPRALAGAIPATAPVAVGPAETTIYSAGNGYLIGHPATPAPTGVKITAHRQTTKI